MALAREEWERRVRRLLSHLFGSTTVGEFLEFGDEARELAAAPLADNVRFRLGALRAALDEIARQTSDGWTRSRANETLAEDEKAKGFVPEPEPETLCPDPEPLCPVCGGVVGSPHYNGYDGKGRCAPKAEDPGTCPECGETSVMVGTVRNLWGAQCGNGHFWGPASTGELFAWLQTSNGAARFGLPKPLTPEDLSAQVLCEACGHSGRLDTYCPDLTSVHSAILCPKCGSTKNEYNSEHSRKMSEATGRTTEDA